MLIDNLLVPITALGAFAGVAGLLAWLTWGFEMWKDFPIVKSFNPYFASCLFLLAGYLTGSACRLGVISRYQIRNEHPTELAFTQVFSALGIALLLLAWRSRMPILIQGWAVVAICFGWWRAGAFFLYSTVADSKLMRT
jgi:hypothetical protein